MRRIRRRLPRPTVENFKINLKSKCMSWSSNIDNIWPIMIYMDEVIMKTGTFNSKTFLFFILSVTDVR